MKRRIQVLGTIILLYVSLSFLSFLTSDKFTINRYPYFERSEVKVNPYPYIEVIPATHLCDDKTDVMVLVNSAIQNTEKRRVIRDTWAHYVQNGKWLHGQDIKQWNIRVGFILGMSTDPDEEKQIEEESERTRDIIKGDFIDVYRNLTLKSLFGVRWMTRHCLSAKYLLKSDDDVIINFPQVLKLVESSSQRTNFIWGPLTPNGRTKRKGKYNMKYTEYPYYYLPPFMRGSAYVMSADTLQKIFVTSEYIPSIPMDDVYITGVLPSVLGINLYSIDAEKWGKWEPTPCGLLTGTYITGIYENALAQKEVWKTMEEVHPSQCRECSFSNRILGLCSNRTNILN